MDPSADEPLTAWCESVIRFIAAQMLDPHRNFEQKLLGQLELADGDADREHLFRQLAGWLSTDALLNAAQRQALDGLLQSRGWPDTRLAEQDPVRTLHLLRNAGGQAQPGP